MYCTYGRARRLRARRRCRVSTPDPAFLFTILTGKLYLIEALALIQRPSSNALERSRSACTPGVKQSSSGVDCRVAEHARALPDVGGTVLYVPTILGPTCFRTLHCIIQCLTGSRSERGRAQQQAPRDAHGAPVCTVHCMTVSPNPPFSFHTSPHQCHELGLDGSAVLLRADAVSLGCEASAYNLH